MHAPKILHQQAQFSKRYFTNWRRSIILLVRTGIITVSDFRQKHLAAGGEELLWLLWAIIFSLELVDRKPNHVELGGIGNFTFLPKIKIQEAFCYPYRHRKHLDRRVSSTGFPERSYDKDAEIAEGTVKS